MTEITTYIQVAQMFSLDICKIPITHIQQSALQHFFEPNMAQTKVMNPCTLPPQHFQTGSSDSSDWSPANQTPTKFLGHQALQHQNPLHSMVSLQDCF